jgi:hypothetical protein
MKQGLEGVFQWGKNRGEKSCERFKQQLFTEEMEVKCR